MGAKLSTVTVDPPMLEPSSTSVWIHTHQVGFISYVVVDKVLPQR